MKMQSTQPDFRYRITSARTGTEEVIDIHVDPQEQHIRIAPEFDPPPWTRLDYFQCSHCPLDPAEYEHCPLALSLAYLLPNDALGTSHEPVSLSVETEQRSFQSETKLQRALSSLFGLIAPLSGCPHTRFLRPMALFHLPVATEQENVVRALAFGLLQRYLEHRRDPSIPLDLRHLEEAYRNLNRLNRDFLRRVRPDSTTDASVNALLLLEVLSREMNWEMEDDLATVAKLFNIPEAADDTDGDDPDLPRVNFL